MRPLPPQFPVPVAHPNLRGFPLSHSARSACMRPNYTEAVSKYASFVRSTLLDRRPMAAYVGGWLGKQNLGDEALFAADRALFPGLNLLVFDGGRVTSQLVRRAPRFRGGILGGGTLIAQKR